MKRPKRIRPLERPLDRPVKLKENPPMLQPEGREARHEAVSLERDWSEQSFDEFYERDYAKLVAAVGFVTGDLDVARDAVDEACARAWECLRRGADIDVLAAWVRTVAMNYARGRFRRVAIDRKARARLAVVDDAGQAESIDARLDVHRALATLPRRQREVCVCFYFLDCSVAETAATLGTSEGNVKSSLHRARQALAEMLGTTNEAVTTR